MNGKMIALVAGLSLGVSFLGTALFSNATGNPSGQSAAAATVLNAGEIRAAFIPYPPYLIKDPNTGAFSGIDYDILEAAGKNLGLKIRWTEEANWATFSEGLKSGRYDIIGSGVWANAARAKVSDFTTPVFYSAIGVYVRANDDRFANVARVNSSDVTIVAIDGEVSSEIAKAIFPKAKVLSLPQDTPISQLLLSVVTHKADVGFAQGEVGAEYIANNPGSLKNISIKKPVWIYPTTFPIAQNQLAFKSMLDTALQELINNGEVGRIIKKYEKYPGSIYEVAPPYTPQ